jgi:hypothetical protein
MTHRYWTLIAHTLCGQPTTRRDCNRTWHHVAFYNYIQEFSGGRARIRPKRHMWEAARSPFLAVLEELKPEAVLVVGKLLWENLPNRVAVTDGVMSQQGILERAGAKVPAAYIKHPASRGFSSMAWHSVVRLLGPSQRVSFQ